MSYSKNLPKPVRAASVLIVPVHTHTCMETGELINTPRNLHPQTTMCGGMLVGKSFSQLTSKTHATINSSMQPSYAGTL